MIRTPSRRAVAIIGSASEEDTCSTCARAPVQRARSMTSAIAKFSAPRGRERRKVSYFAPCGVGAFSMARESSACTIMTASNVASSAMSRSISSASSGGNSSTPECSRKHLKPKTPSSCRPRRSPRFPGTAPPQNPTSTNAWCSATLRFTSSAATSTVGGIELSGMSTIVVTPPAAAARVAEAKPSHSVRPGSLTWTWVSTRPGSSTSSSARSITRAPSRPLPSGSMATIRPPVTPISRGCSPAVVMIRCPRTTRS